MIVASISTGLWIAALVYFKSYDTTDRRAWDIWSWTCNHKFVTDEVDMITMCNEFQATWIVGVMLVAVEVVALGFVVWDAVKVLREGRYAKLEG